MSSPRLGAEGEGPGNVSFMDSSTCQDSISKNGLGMEERNYLGLSDSSSGSLEGPAMETFIEERKGSLNLKATELRLGLPGSESPERSKEPLSFEMLDEKLLFPLLPSKDGICSSVLISGNKRVFSDTINEFSTAKSASPGERNWMFAPGVSNSEASQSAGQGKLSAKSGINLMLSNRPVGTQPIISSEGVAKAPMEQLPKVNGSGNKMNVSNSGSAPAAKAQVVGWPPIRSFRKNTLATTSKNNDEDDKKQTSGAFFVKVSMDGAPYLRKVDLRGYSTYQELSSALEKMFSCFTFGKSGTHDGPGSESKLRALHGSEYVLTFEDKDGDWMLVGDVPWEMFIESCKRLKIIKRSDAIGLASGTVEKSKNMN